MLEFARSLPHIRAKIAEHMGRRGLPREKVIATVARHPRWTFHFTSTSASWLNAVEGFFAKLTRRRLKRGVFRSVADLQATINRFVEETNSDPKPFVWTADVKRVLAAVKRERKVRVDPLDRRPKSPAAPLRAKRKSMTALIPALPRKDLVYGRNGPLMSAIMKAPMIWGNGGCPRRSFATPKQWMTKQKAVDSSFARFGLMLVGKGRLWVSARAGLRSANSLRRSSPVLIDYLSLDIALLRRFDRTCSKGNRPREGSDSLTRI
jgi:transposase